MTVGSKEGGGDACLNTVVDAAGIPGIGAETAPIGQHLTTTPVTQSPQAESSAMSVVEKRPPGTAGRSILRGRSYLRRSRNHYGSRLQPHQNPPANRMEVAVARSKRSQSAHDAKVRQEAHRLKRMGFEVEADIAGFSRPGTIGGYRPDVVAKKPGDRRIVEVETEDSKNSARDLKQQQAFRRAAARSDTTTYRRSIADK